MPISTSENPNKFSYVTYCIRITPSLERAKTTLPKSEGNRLPYMAHTLRSIVYNMCKEMSNKNLT